MNADDKVIMAIAQNYSSYHHRISKHITMFERKHFWAPDSREIDVFGRCWSMAWPHLPNDVVSMHRLGEKVKLNGPLVLFVPPYSIIDTEITGGEIIWKAIISDLPLGEWAPKKAALFERDESEEMPLTIDGVVAFFENHKKEMRKSYLVEKVEVESAIAEKFRNFLNENFEEEFSINDLSSKLGYNHAVLDRAFKKAYGISPINYRNKMRVLDAVHKLVLGEQNVTDVGYDVGFKTTGNFNKQFKKIMKIPPSDFVG